ncbi:MAG: NAD(P)-dependent oxidoreductase [Candidatus Omnitrophica bacterium]|nr:NAD(P)-dependent oxidoreductase [Candidatus Omnitrophota bacterium]
MMKILIFGGAGFLGSHVADFLSEQGHDVTIFDLKKSEYLQKNQKMVVADMTDQAQVMNAVKGQDIIYNFAGVADINFAKDNPYETLTQNFIGNLNILEACVKSNIKRYVFASTLYVYSALGSFYRASKQSCELTIESYADHYNLDFTVLRFGSLYGPRASESNWVYRILSQALEKKKMVREGDGEEIREYIHVHDAAKLSAKILEKDYRNQYIIISGNQSIKIKDLLVMVREMLNNSVDIEFIEGKNDHHYEITPYNFRPKLAKKISDSGYIDLGQGILDLIYNIADRKASLDAELRQILNSLP